MELNTEKGLVRRVRESLLVLGLKGQINLH